LIQFADVHYSYPQTAGDIGSRIHIRRWSIASGECVALIGASGSGKTTLLQLAGGILPVADGSIQVAEQSLGSMHETKRRRFRLANVGFVFQSFELIPHLTGQENLLLPFQPKACHGSINCAKNLTSPKPYENAGQIVCRKGSASELLSAGHWSRNPVLFWQTNQPETWTPF
jgi:ABC-type lipoprotein export system ATPase subunit